MAAALTKDAAHNCSRHLASVFTVVLSLLKAESGSAFRDVSVFSVFVVVTVSGDFKVFIAAGCVERSEHRIVERAVVVFGDGDGF
eukprot:1642689-Pyramimonas_sp.AAC.1